MSDQSFTEWVSNHCDSISLARSLSVSSIPTEPSEISLHLAKVRHSFVCMGDLLQDATTWVLKSHAVATQESRNKWPDYTADERKAMTKADPSYLCALKIKGDIEITVSALKAIHFEAMNARKTTFHVGANSE